MSNDSWEEIAVRLADMSRILLAKQSVQETLDEIVTQAVRLVDGCQDAGVLFLERQQSVRTLAATSDLVHTSDRLQQESGQGPCFNAAQNAEQVYRIADMNTADDRWPRYAPLARELGIGSMMGCLLFTEEGDLGALDMYSPEPDAFTERSERVGWLLASHAAVAFSSARAHSQMNEAVQTRHEIGAAIGIVMERYKMSEDQAFAVLRKSSQARNVKLRDVARTVTETGEIPGTC